MNNYRPKVHVADIDPVQHMHSLLTEIEMLKMRVQPTDTGHIRTAIIVLEDRVKEITNNILISGTLEKMD